MYTISKLTFMNRVVICAPEQRASDVGPKGKKRVVSICACIYMTGVENRTEGGATADNVIGE